MAAKPLDPNSAPLALLLLRFLIGALFLAHLYWKFFVFRGGLSGWWAGFAAARYPAYVPYYVVSAETLGALMIIPGIWPRWVALYAAPMMAGAAQFWLVRKGFFFVGGGAELPMVWCALLILLALFGDGPFAIAPSPAPWRSRSR